MKWALFGSRHSARYTAFCVAALALLAHFLTGMEHLWLEVIAFGACGVAVRFAIDHRRTQQAIEVLRWMDSGARRHQATALARRR
jgi:hypothetical protein